jgi:pyrophosphatase PpaX
MIKAILFDIDGVLLDSFEVNLKYFQNIMEKAGYPPPTREEYKKLFHLPSVDVIRALAQTEDDQEIQRIKKINETQVPYPLNEVKTQANVPEVITHLSQKYKLGLVTSRKTELVWKLPPLAELKHYFSLLISLDDVTKPKPDPEPLLLAAERLGLQPVDCIYVGDAITDFQAATAAGMKIIMYNNPNLENADGYASSFIELLSLLERI